MSTTTAASFPDGIADEHLEGVSGWRRHASPLSLAIFGAVVALALAGFLGHERDWEATSGATRLSIHAPEILRNGEFLEMRIRVESEQGIGALSIGMDQSIWEDFTINTMIPAAAEETSEDGEFRFSFGELSDGASFLLKIDAQVNPDFVGANDGTVTVFDGENALVQTSVRIQVLP